MGFRTIFAFLPVLLTAFGPMEGPMLKEENHYNLRFLRDSRTPVEMKLVRYDTARQKQVVERGVLLSYKSRTARRVLLAGDFSDWKPLAMERGNNGVWYYFVTGTVAEGRARYKLRQQTVEPVFGIIKHAVKAAVFGAVLSVAAWIWYFNIR